MTLDDMKSLLAGRLGQRTDIDNMIYSEIRQAQNTLEKTPPYPWFLLMIEQIEWAAHPNPLPVNFIEMLDDIVYLVKKTDETVAYNPTIKIYGSYLEYIGQTVTGRPKYFTLVRDFIIFYPYPDVSYTFNLVYYGKDNLLSGGSSSNLWSTRAEDLLVAEAGWHVARNIRDNEAATLFGQDRAEARRRIAQESTSRLESMRRAVIAGGEDAEIGLLTR